MVVLVLAAYHYLRWKVRLKKQHKNIVSIRKFKIKNPTSRTGVGFFFEKKAVRLSLRDGYAIGF